MSNWTTKKGRPFKNDPKVLIQKIQDIINSYLKNEPPLYRVIKVGNQARLLPGEVPILSRFLLENHVSEGAFYRLLKHHPELAHWYEMFRMLQIDRLTNIMLMNISYETTKGCIFLLKMAYKRREKEMNKIQEEIDYQQRIEELNKILNKIDD